MLKDKILPIIDKAKKLPSFYAARSLTKNDVKDIIRFYEFMLNSEMRTVKTSIEKPEQIGN